MHPPEGALPKNTVVTDFPKVKSLPPRTNIQYKNNRGFHLTVEGLPWGKAAFTVQRYRLTAQEAFAMQESTGSGGRFELTDALPPPGLELIVLKKD